MPLKLDKTLNADMGSQFDKIEKFVNGLDGQSIANLDVSGLEVETADAAGDNAAVINEIKVNFNTLIDRLAALQP